AVTRPGVIIGSPAFMAPERASRGLATPASDMWSLGATLFAAVEGRSPYARPGALATLTALATQQPDPAPHAGPLAEVIDGLLRRDPASRMPATEVARRLRRIAATQIPHQVPVVPRPAIESPLTHTRVQPPARRRTPTRVAVLNAVLALLTVAELGALTLAYAPIGSAATWSPGRTVASAQPPAPHPSTAAALPAGWH